MINVVDDDCSHITKHDVSVERIVRSYLHFMHQVTDDHNMAVFRDWPATDATYARRGP